MPPILDVPYRSPFEPFIHMKDLFENKKVFDLGCGRGDLMQFLYEHIKCSSIKGIDINTDKKQDNLDIIVGSILDLEFKSLEIDIYFCWIENPDLEKYIIESLIYQKIKTKLVIAYSHQQHICGKCDICSYLNTLQDKKNILSETLNGFVKNNQITYETITYCYNDGESCRQKGEFEYHVIDINPF